MLIDCKVVSTDRGFVLSRAEENQRSAMRMFERICNEICWFALKLPDGEIRMMVYQNIAHAENNVGIRSIPLSEMEEWTVGLDKWFEFYERRAQCSEK